MRRLAKKYNALAVSVTQAGDSGENKAILNMGDIDGSNTGIQGTADLIIGLGATYDMIQRGMLTLSFSKNKLNGNKQPVSITINPGLVRVE